MNGRESRKDKGNGRLQVEPKTPSYHPGLSCTSPASAQSMAGLPGCPHRDGAQPVSHPREQEDGDVNSATHPTSFQGASISICYIFKQAWLKSHIIGGCLMEVKYSLEREDSRVDPSWNVSFTRKQRCLFNKKRQKHFAFHTLKLQFNETENKSHKQEGVIRSHRS